MPRTRVGWRLYIEQLPQGTRCLVYTISDISFCKYVYIGTSLSQFVDFFPYLVRQFQKAVCLLLNHGADADTKDKSWLTPLHVSAANWAIGCADAPIPHLTSLDTADKSGRTALLHAAYSGQDEVSFTRWTMVYVMYQLAKSSVTSVPNGSFKYLFIQHLIKWRCLK